MGNHVIARSRIAGRRAALLLMIACPAGVAAPAWADGGSGGFGFNSSGGPGGADSATGAGVVGGNGSGSGGLGAGGGGGAGTTGGDGGDGGGGAGGQGGLTPGSSGQAGSTGAGAGGGGGGAHGSVSASLPGVGTAGGNGGSGGNVNFGGSGGGGGGAGGYGAVVTGSGSSTSSVDFTGGAGGAGGTSFGSLGSSGNGGSGGVGLAFTTGASLTTSGTIQGGLGGDGGFGPGGSRGGTGGVGGTGLTGSGLTITNGGSIAGGNGGALGGSAGGTAGSAGAGGAGIAGSGLTIVNNGSITGGLGGNGTTRANAITFTGGVNTLTLQGGSLSGNIAVQGGSLTFNQSTGQTLANVITGTGAVIQSGTGTLILTGNNTYSGITTISSGSTLQIGNGGSTGSLGTGNITNNGTLTFNNNGNYDLTNQVSGSGALTLGGGQVTIGAANTYTGATLINAGKLKLGGGSLDSTSALTINGTGIFDLNGQNQTIGSLTGASGATVALGSGGLTVGDATASTGFAGAITGGGSVIKQGSGELVLSGTNTYTGGTTINAGTLTLGASNTLASSGAVTVNNGGTLQLNAAFSQTIDSLTGVAGSGISLGNGAALTAGTTSTTVASAISGGGSLVKAGAGTLTLNGNNTYSGGTTINAGTLAVAANNNLGGGTITFNGGTLALPGGATLLFGNAIVLNNGGGTINNSVVGSYDILSGGISGAGGLTTTGVGMTGIYVTPTTYQGPTLVREGVLAAIDTNVLSPNSAFTVSSGASLELGRSQVIGSLAGNGNVTTGVSSTPTLTVGGDNTSTVFGGTLGEQGQLSLTKAGSGTLTLTGTNTYSGATTINAGALAVNGSITSNTTVNAGGTLQGTGTITGNVTVMGNIGPGNSIGTLNVTGTYTQNAGSTYQVEVNAAGQSDKIAVTGNAVLNGGTVAVQAAAGTYARNTTYTILSATGTVTGTYAGLTSNLAFLAPSLSYSANSVVLTLVSLASAFQNGGQTANQKAVGAALDLAITNATGDFNTVLNAMFNLSTSQGPQVLDAIGGQNYAGFGSLMIQGSLLFMDSFSVHAGGSGGTGLGARLPGGGTYMALKADDCDTACDVEPLWGVWGGGVGAFGTVAGDSNGKGLSYNLGGFVAGLDRKFAPNFRAGVASGFNAASLYTNGMPGTGTSNTVQLALYGDYIEGRFYLDALAGYAHSDNRMNRPITIPGLPFRSAQGHSTANTFFGQLEAGYKIPVAPSFGGFVTPFARLQGVTSTQNGFSETGADSLNLNVAGQTTNSLRTVLGAQLGAAIDAPWREKLNVNLRLGWSHEFADSTRPVNASFAGAPAIGFATFGAQAPRDGMVLGFGANTQVAERTSVYLRYDGDLAGGNTNHAFNAGVRFVW